MGLSGQVPYRVDAATKAAVLALVDEALEVGWNLRRICGVLELPERRAYRWLVRRAGDRLADRAPGGAPLHGLLDDEVASILGLFDEWGEVDRSHRKLAHRGSYLGRVWVSPSTVRRVLTLLTSTFVHYHGLAGRNGGRSPNGLPTPRTVSGSTTRPISPGRGWRC